MLSRIAYWHSLLSSLPLSLIPKIQTVQSCAAHLVVCASSSVHVAPILKQLPLKTRISYKIACLCFNAINYSTLSDLLHLYSPSRSLRPDIILCGWLYSQHQLTPVLTTASINSHSINAGRRVIPHFTPEMLQLLMLSSPLSKHI